MSCPRLQKLDLSWNCLDMRAPHMPAVCLEGPLKDSRCCLRPALQQLGQSLAKHRAPEKLCLAGCSGRPISAELPSDLA